MKTRKITKAVGIMLVVAMLATILSVMSFAVEPMEIKVIKAPDRTVLYEEYDTLDGIAFGDPTGMVFEVKNSDGSIVNVDATLYNTMIRVDNYKLGVNEAVVYYFDEESTTQHETVIDITVKENPVQSIEITKMPTKTEYDMDKDVITKKDFSVKELDRIYEWSPQSIEALCDDFGFVDYAECKSYFTTDEDAKEAIIDYIFSEGESLLIFDTAGLEATITFKDGTTQSLNENSDSNIVYEGVEFPAFVMQKNGNIVEGKNALTLSAMGFSKDFDVTVKKAAPTEKPTVPEEKPTEPTTKPTEPATKPADPKPANPKNPVIPNTSGTSAAAAAVLALVSGCGIALVVSKKEK